MTRTKHLYRNSTNPRRVYYYEPDRTRLIPRTGTRSTPRLLRETPAIDGTTSSSPKNSSPPSSLCPIRHRTLEAIASCFAAGLPPPLASIAVAGFPVPLEFTPPLLSFFWVPTTTGVPLSAMHATEEASFFERTPSPTGEDDAKFCLWQGLLS